MSFTSETKHEICQLEADENQKRAQLCALLLARATLTMNAQGIYLTFQTENAAIAKRVFEILRTLYGVTAGLSVLKKMNLKKNNIYRLIISEQSGAILEDLTILRESGLSHAPAYRLLRSTKNAKAFLQGAFLATGSVSDPKTAKYHLEITASEEEFALSVKKTMERFGFEPKLTQRKGQFVVYIKQSERIADFLRLLGASDALFQFEDSRITRDFYNQITRLDNCEVANEMKSQKAAKAQLEWIEVIESCPALEVPQKVRQAMEARKANPDASILELCEWVQEKNGEEISKSGMKHRLRRIQELAQEAQTIQQSRRAG